MNYALITGASSGIGYELALLFAKNGHNLILVARRENKLLQLVDKLKTNYKIETQIIFLDLSRTDAAREIFRQVHEKSVHVNYLVNNAGFYVKGPFSETLWEAERNLIELQCLQYTQLIKLFLPAMLQHNKGGILNIGSTGSFVPGPFNAVYCASKSFVLNLSEALAQEVSGTGVTISALCPGRTNTTFQNLRNRNRSVFFPTMEPSRVAQIGYHSFMKGKRVIIPGWTYKIQVALTRFIPRGIVTRLTSSISSINSLLI